MDWTIEEYHEFVQHLIEHATYQCNNPSQFHPQH